MNLPDPLIVADSANLRKVAKVLSAEPLIAFDTESNSLHAYRERVCLIQVSTRTADYVIDPLELDNLEPLRGIFADPGIEKVFHAAEYDIMCLKRDYGFSFQNIFDTMFAARVLGRKQFGLGALLEEFFGIQADKRFQRADWSQRPIPPDWLQYAQQDTHYLLEVRDRLRAELEAEGRLSEAAEMFAALTRVPAAAESHFDPDAFWHIPAAKRFNRRQMAILRELHLWRDSVAQRQNVPAYRIMSDNAMVGIILAKPNSVSALYDVRELGASNVRRHGRDILEMIERGLNAPLPTPPPHPPQVEPAVQERYDMLHTWRKETAAKRGVESDIILSKESMWAMARKPPATLRDLDDVPGLGPWRRETYGAQLLTIFSQSSQSMIASVENLENPENSPES
jgi:ribonuclease D